MWKELEELNSGFDKMIVNFDDCIDQMIIDCPHLAGSHWETQEYNYLDELIKENIKVCNACGEPTAIQAD